MKITSTLFLLLLFLLNQSRNTIADTVLKTERTSGVNLAAINRKLADRKKLRLAEKVADRFIARWHETLDLNVLFDEMYVTDPVRRRTNIELFYASYAYEVGEPPDFKKVSSALDEAAMRKALFAYWNLRHLYGEYLMSHCSESSQSCSRPDEIVKIGDAYENLLHSSEFRKMLVLEKTRNLISFWDKASAIYRKHLPVKAFRSSLYKANFQSCDHKSRTDREGFDLYKIPKGQPVYYVARGLFRLYMIEENNQIRVLTFGFEL